MHVRYWAEKFKETETFEDSFRHRGGIILKYYLH